MTCILNEDLHGWRVNRSNRFCPEHFLQQDHWITLKSRECDKDIWSVVRVRFGPLATPLYKFNRLIWRTTLKICTHMACISWSRDNIKSIKHHLGQGTHTTYPWLRSHQTSFGHINTVAVNSQYKPWINKLMHHYLIELTSARFFIMNAIEYWLFAHKISIWNTSVAALQFWTEELDPHTLSTTI